ncbi:hypothetical protein [Amycolatopsis sp. lyj-23]|uniref:hypothetical protein n=1 Tax=Amycolatopsis sp. lyj-23 TaxID=2789283 RepID=UPI0039795BE0
MAPWSAAVDGRDAVFSYVPEVGAQPRIQPHAWRGRSVLVPVAAVPGLAAAVEAVLESTATAKVGGLDRWSRARVDRITECVYFDGPVLAGGRNGHTPVRTLFVAVADLRGLRLRLTAYLAAPGLA